MNNSTTDNNTMKYTSTIFFGGGLSVELTGEDGALRKCPVDIFSERASMRRERQGAATGLAVSALNHVAHKIEFGDFLDERAKQLFGEDYKEKFGVSKLKLGCSIGKNGIATASGDVYTYDKNSEYSAYQYSIDFYDSKGWSSNEFYDLLNHTEFYNELFTQETVVNLDCNSVLEQILMSVTGRNPYYISDTNEYEAEWYLKSVGGRTY